MKKTKCSKCGNERLIMVLPFYDRTLYNCMICGHKWEKGTRFTRLKRFLWKYLLSDTQKDKILTKSIEKLR